MKRRTDKRDQEIRERFKSGFSAQELSAHYGISVSSIRRIVNTSRPDKIRKVYVGKRTWALVKELSLEQGIGTNALMGRIVRQYFEGAAQ